MSTPNPLEALACGSASTTRTDFSNVANDAAKLIVVVVLPTPPLIASNVMILDPETKKPTRIKKVQQEDGKYVRASVKSGAILDKVK